MEDGGLEAEMKRQRPIRQELRWPLLRFRYAMKGQPKGAIATVLWEREGVVCIRFPIGAPPDWTRHRMWIAQEAVPKLFVQSRKWELDEHDNVVKRPGK